MIPLASPIGKFQSTPSVWRETITFFGFSFFKIFQSTPSVWRETLLYHRRQQKSSISIHSLRVEGDQVTFVFLCSQVDFNPLPPCGGRLQTAPAPASSAQFQSTPSVWRETICLARADARAQFQSTPSVWRETSGITAYCLRRAISIHSLRVEGD